MNQLPNEILEVVLEYISPVSKPLLFTCKLWNSIIIKMLLKSNPPIDLVLKNEINFKYVGSLFLKSDEFKNDMIFPNLKELTTCDHESEDNEKLINFLSNHLSLISLDIRRISHRFQEGTDKFIQELPKTLSKLQRLTKFSYNDFIEDNLVILLSSLAKLPLRHLDLKVCLNGTDVMQFFSINLKSIEVLKLSFQFGAPIDALSFNYSFPLLKSFQINTDSVNYRAGLSKLLPKYFPILTEFSTRTGAELLNLLDTNSFNHFPNLDLRIEIDGDEFILRPYGKLNVKDLNHCIESEREFITLCDNLQHFKNITMLFIEFGDEYVDDDYIDSFYDSKFLKPAFRQLHHLKDLSLYELSNDDVFSEQFEFSLECLSLQFKDSPSNNNLSKFILFNCPDLEHLYLPNVPINFTNIDITKVNLKRLRQMYLFKPGYTYEILSKFIGQLPNLIFAEVHTLEVAQMLRSKFPFICIK